MLQLKKYQIQMNLKELLIKQIENRVRWRESVINMINNELIILLKLAR